MIIIVLTVLVLTSGRMHTKVPQTGEQTWDCVDRDNGDITSVKMAYTGAGKHGGGCKCPKCSNVEANALAEQSEHFESCRNSAEDTARALDCMCEGNDNFQYAVNEFGAPGMEFKDWVASQSVDPTVIKNHAEFVSDRFNNQKQMGTGATYSPDSHDSFDPVPWVGIRGRPQAVAVCNPTQVPDLDENMFARGPKLVWNSGATH